MKKPKSQKAGHHPDPKPNKAPGDNRDDRDNRSAKLSPTAVPFDELELAEKVFPNSKALAVYREARAAVNSLVALADKGDKVAARCLWRLAHDLTRWMSFSKTPGGDLVRSLAPEYTQWPVLASRHPGVLKELMAELEALRVGEQSGIRSDKKAKWGKAKYGTYSLATHHALELKRVLTENQYKLRLAAAAEKRGAEKYDLSTWKQWQLKCKVLPPLSKATALKDWWPLMCEAMMDGTGGHPERDPRLRSLGVHRANPYSKRGVNRSGKIPKGTQEANIREGIFTAIKQALVSLARKADSPAS